MQLKKNHILNLGKGGGGFFVILRLMTVVQYLYQSILFMNEGTLQLTIRTKTNFPLMSQLKIYKHKTSVPEDFSKIMLQLLLDKNLFEPVIFITPDDKIYH